MGAVLKLVLSAALGSFLFGFNLGNLNTSLSSINGSLQFCGRPDPKYDSYKNVSLDECSLDKTCRAMCLKYDDGESEPATAVRCPGGFNDLDCGSLKWQNAGIQTALFVGATGGSFYATQLLRYGRRMSLLIGFGVLAMGIVTSAATGTLAVLVWARLIIGVGVGIMSVVPPTYMAEMIPPAERGKYAVMHQFSITIGILISALLGLPLENPGEQTDLWSPSTFQNFWWRFMLGVAMVPVLLGFFIFGRVYKFETPFWSCLEGRKSEAEDVVKFIYNKQQVQDELSEISEQAEAALEQMKNGIKFSTAARLPKYRVVIFFGLALAIFQQLGGVNVFITSSSAIFRDAGFKGSMQTLMSIIMCLINTLMCIPTMFLVDRAGRRVLFIVGTIGQLIFLAPATVLYWTTKTPDVPPPAVAWAAVVGVLGYILCFGIAYGPVLWVYLFEMFPGEISGAASAAAVAFNWFGGVLMVFIAIVSNNRTNFTLFAVLQFIAVILVFLFMKETKGLPIGVSPYTEPLKKAVDVEAATETEEIELD